MEREFGTLLRRLREEAGWSMGQLARALEISTPYLSDVERGNRAPFTSERIALIAHELNLKAESHADLLTASANSRGYFELEMGTIPPAQQQLGAALARGWNSLDDEKVRKMREILESEADED